MLSSKSLREGRQEERGGRKYIDVKLIFKNIPVKLYLKVRFVF